MGREARVVPVYLPNDPYKDCQTLAAELRGIDLEIARLLKESDKGVYNAIMGGTGIFLYVPLLFMDLSQAEREEAEAYRQRHNYLMVLGQQRNCGFATPVQLKPS